jgi:hypothetical protein
VAAASAVTDRAVGEQVGDPQHRGHVDRLADHKPQQHAGKLLARRGGGLGGTGRDSDISIASWSAPEHPARRVPT